MKMKKNTPETAVSKASKKRRLRIGATSTVITVLVVAGLVLLNVVLSVVAERFPLSTDLTDEKLYTLSQDSVDIAKGIDKNVEIVVFYDEDLFVNPENYVSADQGGVELAVVFREFRKALEQYKTYSDAKLTYSFVDLQLNPTSEYLQYDVSPQDILFLIRGEDDEKIDDDIYRIGNINDLYSYEQDLSGNYTYVSRVERILGSKINSVVRNEDPVIQVLTGHSENSTVIEGLRSLYELNGFVLEELDLRKVNLNFNERATIAVIAAPLLDYTEEELTRLSAWLDNDNKLERHLMVFTDTSADCPNLYEYLDVEWGIEVTDELIWETDNNRLYDYNGYASFADGLENDLTKDAVGEANLVFPQARRIKHKLATEDNDGASNPYNIPMVSFPKSAKLVSLENAANGNDPYDADAYPVYGMVSSYKYGYSNELMAGIASTVTVCGSPSAVTKYNLSNPTVKNEEMFLTYAQVAARVDAQMHISIKVLSSDTVNFTAGTAFNLGIWVFTVTIPAVTLLVCLVVFIRRRHL